MKNKKVISYKNLPTKSPLVLTAVAYLYLDKYHASGVVWGIAGTLFVILWIGVIVLMSKEESVNILDKEKQKND